MLDILNTCLGTASREHSGQTNVLMAHYIRPAADKPA